MITPARRVTLRREFPRCSFTRNLSHKYTGHGSELLLLTFWTILGSGQKLLARLLDEHPFVTVKQPSNYIRHVSLFSEAWYEEESLETNRLNEGGISKEVLLDTLQVRSKLRLFSQCYLSQCYRLHPNSISETTASRYNVTCLDRFTIL